MGVSQAVPELHDNVGTSFRDLLMLRGVQLERYQQVTSFKMLSGQALQPGDPQRTAMVGRRLADKLDLTPGQEILIRGRKFQVIGVFHTGTYADNEAWVSLTAAQTLLGWGEDVSLFILPDEGLLHPGDSLPGGLSVARHGAGPYLAISQFDTMFQMLDIVVRTLAVAAVLALTNTLIRLAWLRRRELAILRCVGFQFQALIFYLFSQAVVLALAGTVLGIAGSGAIFTLMRADMGGMSLQPSLDPSLALTCLGLAAGISLLGTALPIAWLHQQKPADLLRSVS
jgi:ABC-type lipoprotein release transport system permease subunit